MVLVSKKGCTFNTYFGSWMHSRMNLQSRLGLEKIIVSGKSLSIHVTWFFTNDIQNKKF